MNFPKANEVCSHYIDSNKFTCDICRVYYNVNHNMYLYLNSSSMFWTNYISCDAKAVYDGKGYKIFSLEDCKDYQDLLNKIKKFEVFK